MNQKYLRNKLLTDFTNILINAEAKNFTYTYNIKIPGKLEKTILKVSRVEIDSKDEQYSSAFEVKVFVEITPPNYMGGQFEKGFIYEVSFLDTRGINKLRFGDHFYDKVRGKISEKVALSKKLVDLII